MALEFDINSDSAVTCVNTSSLSNMDPLTITAWIKPSSWGSSSYGRIVSKGDTSGFVFFVANGGDPNGVATLRFIRARATTDAEYVGADNALSLNVWQHVAVVYESTGSTLYVNGSAITTETAIAGSGALDDDSGYELVIGNRTNIGSLNREFDGLIEDVRIYERALSASEISAIHSSVGHDGISDDMIGRWTFTEEAPGVPTLPDTFFKDLNWDDTSSGSSVTIDVPTHVSGDLLVATIWCEGDNTGVAPNITTPSGWTLVESVDVPDPLDTSRPSMFMFRREAGSSEPTSYTFSCDQTCGIESIMVSYDGTEVDTTVDASGTNTGTSSSPTCPSVTTSADSLVLRATIVHGFSIPSHPDESIERYSGFIFPNNDGAGYAYSEQLKASGATGTAIYSVSTREWGTITAAFNGGPGEWKEVTLIDMTINKNDGTGNAGCTFREGQLIPRRRV